VAAANSPVPSVDDALPAPPAPESSKLPEVIPSGDWQKTSVARLCDSIPDEFAPAVALLDHADPDQRIAGLSELAGHAEAAQPVAPAVRALLKHDDAAVRAHAAEAIFAIEGDAEAATSTLSALLSDSDEAIVQLSCYLLGRMGAPAEEAVPGLEVTLAQASGVTHLHAAEALVRIVPKHEEACIALTRSLESDDRNERWFGAVALGSVTGEQRAEATLALKAALHDSESDVRTAAALSLGGLGVSAEGAIEDLEQIALFDEQGVRDAASTALACLRR
jgi:HEAT repeat protein